MSSAAWRTRGAFDTGPVFDADRLCPHRHDQRKDELCHRKNNPLLRTDYGRVEAIISISRRQDACRCGRQFLLEGLVANCTFTLVCFEFRTRIH